MWPSCHSAQGLGQRENRSAVQPACTSDSSRGSKPNQQPLRETSSRREGAASGFAAITGLQFFF